MNQAPTDILKKAHDILNNKYQYITGSESNCPYSIEEIFQRIVDYYESIISCMPGNVYWFDQNLIAVGCNKNVLDMFGFKSLAEFKGLTFEGLGKIAQWNPEAMLSFKNDTLEVLKTGVPKLGIEEPPIPHSDGRMLYFLSSRVPIFDQAKSVIGVIGISIDITYRKEMELALIKAKEEAEASALAKSEFMENMSHDFKTPLNGIMGVVQIFKMYENLPEEFGNLIKTQEKSVLRLKRLVDSILDFDKLHSGKVEIQLEELNLLDIIESIVDNLSYQLHNKDVNIIINYPSEVPRYLIGDSHCVTTILLNLMSNAVKFTEQGHVTITTRLLTQENDSISLQITIQDTGSGIPADKMKNIFERFQRIGLANTGLKEGQGIGLAVVKELIEKLNGTIDVESELGVGSTFTLTLPFKLQDMAIFISDWQRKHQDVRILLACDKRTSSDILLEHLGKGTTRKVQSKDVINELLFAAQSGAPYQILIVDNEIEYVDPVQLAKVIYSVSAIPRPLLLCSTQPKNKEWLDNARAGGYFDFIIKPLLPSELDRKITEAWNKWQQKTLQTI